MSHLILRCLRAADARNLDEEVSGFSFFNTMPDRYSEKGTWLTDHEHVSNG
jgi:hypothetical protein